MHTAHCTQLSIETIGTSIHTYITYELLPYVCRDKIVGGSTFRIHIRVWYGTWLDEQRKDGYDSRVLCAAMVSPHIVVVVVVSNMYSKTILCKSEHAISTIWHRRTSHILIFSQAVMHAVCVSAIFLLIVLVNVSVSVCVCVMCVYGCVLYTLYTFVSAVIWQFHMHNTITLPSTLRVGVRVCAVRVGEMWKETNKSIVIHCIYALLYARPCSFI